MNLHVLIQLVLVELAVTIVVVGPRLWQRLGMQRVLTLVTLGLVLAELVLVALHGHATEDVQALAFLAAVAFGTRVWSDRRARAMLALPRPLRRLVRR